MEEKLPVVFKIEFSNGNIASAVSEAAQKKLRKEEKASGKIPDQGDTAPAAAEEMDPQDSLQNSRQNSLQTGGRTRVRVLQLHSCHNVTRDEMASGETCLSLMKKNLEALREALN